MYALLPLASHFSTVSILMHPWKVKKKKKSSDLVDSLVRPISDCDDGEISMPDINKWNYYDKGVLGIPTNTTVMFFSN